MASLLDGLYFKEKGGEMVPRGPEDQKDTCLTHMPDGHGVHREIRVYLQPSFGSEKRRRRRVFLMTDHAFLRPHCGVWKL